MSCIPNNIHITLVLLALAYLTGLCAPERFSTVHPTPSESATRPPALPLTIVFRAPSARPAHLALFFVHTPGAGMPRGGVVATKALRAITTSNAVVICWLILAGSHHPLGFVLARAHFPDFQEISWKCRSSWKSVRVLSPIVSFLAQEF
jgi:hypothetical protein